MPLYHLKRTTRASYDEFEAILVRAPDAAQAKVIAKKYAVDFYHDSWPEEAEFRCSVVKETGEAKVIIGDFRAG